MENKRINLMLPAWQYQKYIEGNGRDPDRVRELITKGIMFEQEQKVLKQNNKKDNNAVSVTWSRDYISRGLAGFPESAIN